jgi:hypothetical protein
MLRFFVNKQLSNWDELLLCCEFACNNNEQASTGETPFFLNYGLHPLTPVTRELPAELMALETPDRLERLAKAPRDAKDAIQEAQRRQKDQADKSRRHVHFEVGQNVLLKLKGRPQQKGPAQKLRPERAGPFITEAMHPGVSMKLDMSGMNWKGHDVFHVSQLTHYCDGADTFPSRSPESVQPEDVAHLDGWEAEHREYAVNEIKAACVSPATKRKEWLASWRGYAADDDLWIQQSQMNDILRAETVSRDVKLMGEGVQLAMLEQAPPSTAKPARRDEEETWQIENMCTLSIVVVASETKSFERGEYCSVA